MYIFAENITIMALNIKKVISDRGLTSKEVAERMGISTVGLSQHINGNPTVEVLNRISIAIGCEIDDLFDKKNTIKCPHCGNNLNIKIE